SIRLRNWSVSWNATFCAPVAASPESSSSALVRLLPVNPKRDSNAGGSAPPLSKKVSIAWPTLNWLTVKAGAGDTGVPRYKFRNKARRKVEHGGIAWIGQARLEVCRRPKVVRASNVPVRPPAAVKMV